MKNNFKKFVFTLFIFVIFIFNFSFADWQNDNGRYKYLNGATGQYVTNNWLQTGNGFYYLDGTGYAVVGWYLINGKYYYFDKNGLMQTGFQEINGRKYYLDANNGQMVTGWVQTYEDGVVDYYYFNENGEEAIGWKQIENKWYYFYEGKCLVGTFAKINDIWYHFNTSGAMDTGWVTERGKMYYFNISNGSLTRGWIQDQQGNEYYLSEIDGSLTVNTTINIAGVGCTFDAMGRCIAKNNNASSINGMGIRYGSGLLGNNLVDPVYGVNVGVSPALNQMSSAITSANQEYIDAQPLEAGDTTGPK